MDKAHLPLHIQNSDEEHKLSNQRPSNTNVTLISSKHCA